MLSQRIDSWLDSSDVAVMLTLIIIVIIQHLWGTIDKSGDSPEIQRCSMELWLLVCQQDYTKRYRLIWLKFSGKVRRGPI